MLSVCKNGWRTSHGWQGGTTDGKTEPRLARRNRGWQGRTTDGKADPRMARPTHGWQGRTTDGKTTHGWQGRTTDGKADPRMNTFDTCGLEMNTVNLRSMSLSNGPWSKRGSAGFSSAVRLCHPWESPNSGIGSRCASDQHQPRDPTKNEERTTKNEEPRTKNKEQRTKNKELFSSDWERFLVDGQLEEF